METKKLRNLALETFKTINDLNPSFMKSIFSAKLKSGVRHNDILVKAINLPLLEIKFYFFLILNLIKF